MLRLKTNFKRSYLHFNFTFLGPPTLIRMIHLSILRPNKFFPTNIFPLHMYYFRHTLICPHQTSFYPIQQQCMPTQPDLLMIVSGIFTQVSPTMQVARDWYICHHMYKLTPLSLISYFCDLTTSL